MATIPLIIGKVERRGVTLARVFVSKKMFTFDWDKSRPDREQYSTISELTLNALREESPGHRIGFTGEPLPLPDSFDFGGVLYLVSVERK